MAHELLHLLPGLKAVERWDPARLCAWDAMLPVRPSVYRDFSQLLGDLRYLAEECTE